MKLTIRLRIALITAGLTLVGGAVLLTVAYQLVSGHLSNAVGAQSRGEGQRAYADYQGTSPYPGSPASLAVRSKKTTLNSLVTWGGLTLVPVTVAAGWAGWSASGWALRSLRRLTETTRRVAQSHDLTERIGYEGPREDVRDLADSFDAMTTRLARAFAGQRRFVANASHELRTPLAINRTLVDVAVRRPDASDDLKRLGESLLLVNTRHERLIDGLLALAEGEQSILDGTELDLADVVEHVLDQAAGSAKEASVTIQRLLDPAPTIGDPVLLERIAQNLVENAIRHNVEGGEVWVTTRRRADSVELVVANSGLVVPPYELELIFEPFRRLHGDRLGSERGSGLGLSIVRAITDAHHGSVTVQPREEGGLTVTVELPAP